MYPKYYDETHLIQKLFGHDDQAQSENDFQNNHNCQRTVNIKSSDRELSAIE